MSAGRRHTKRYSHRRGGELTYGEPEYQTLSLGGARLSKKSLKKHMRY
jgi:hypothetical protein